MNGKKIPGFILFMRELDTSLMMLLVFSLAGYSLYLFKEAIIEDGAAGIIGIIGTIIGYAGHMVQSAWTTRNEERRADSYNHSEPEKEPDPPQPAMQERKSRLR